MIRLRFQECSWLKSGGSFVEGFSADVAARFHHLRIDVTDLSLDDRVGQPLSRRVS